MLGGWGRKGDKQGYAISKKRANSSQLTSLVKPMVGKPNKKDGFVRIMTGQPIPLQRTLFRKRV